MESNEALKNFDGRGTGWGLNQVQVIFQLDKKSQGRSQALPCEKLVGSLPIAISSIRSSECPDREHCRDFLHKLLPSGLVRLESQALLDGFK